MNSEPQSEIPMFTERREILHKLKKAGVPFDKALLALIDEAYYISQTRVADNMHPENSTPEQKQIDINHLLEMGINGRNAEITQMTAKTLSELKSLIQTDRE